jgi:hypothetical protein
VAIEVEMLGGDRSADARARDEAGCTGVEASGVADEQQICDEQQCADGE